MKYKFAAMLPVRPRRHGHYYGIKDSLAISLSHDRLWYGGCKYKNGKNYFEHDPIIRPRTVVVEGRP